VSIRQRWPDRKNAASLLEAARRDMEFTLKMPVSEDSGPTIVRNIYECFRMLGDALLATEGKEADDHVTAVKELLRLHAKTARPISLIDNLRRLRHSINYYGYRPSKQDAEEAISIAEATFEPLLRKIKSRLSAAPSNFS
jgi:hypothetical protein